MKKSKLYIAIVVVECIIACYLLYLLFFDKEVSEEPIIIPTPTTPVITSTPIISPTPRPTIVPTNTPTENKRIVLYNGIYLTYKDDKNIIKPMVDDDDSVVFEINGNNLDNREIYFEIILNAAYSNSSVFNKLTINLFELDDNNTIIKRIDIDKYNTLNNRLIYVGTIARSSVVNKRYKIQITHDGRNAYNDISVDVKISLNKKSPVTKASSMVIKSIQNHPNTTWTDTSDRVIYFSGTNSAVNYNYVWYSGKLWRITAINPDGTMRMITDNMMTTINWGKNIEYNGSWVYQWLNEDFYSTLYNPQNLLVANTIWNYTTDGNSIPNKPETLPNQKKVSAPIGLLSSYEYYNAYRNSKNTDNYLNNSHYWWHITPQHNMAVRSTSESGKEDLHDRNPANYGRGIRPVVYLNSYVEFTGSGSKSDPYRIVGDIDVAKSRDYLNSRISGEYLKFDNDLYRIVDITGNQTKIVRVDYLKNGDKWITKQIARTIYFGRTSNTQSDVYWDYYLRNIWYPKISPTYRNMIISGVYYLGSYYLNTHYKHTLCQDVNLDVVNVQKCNKYKDADHTYYGLVGLLRVGEMFSAQQLEYELEPPTFWTITPYDDTENRIILETNSLYNHATWGGFHVVHPTLYLKENIRIASGTGTFLNPYIISE